MIYSILCILALGLATPAQGIAQSPDWNIENQFGQPLAAAEVREGELVLLFVSSRRDAAELLHEWHDALTPGLPQEARQLYVADLRRLPFFVPRGAVVGVLRREHPTLPIWLDWKGVLCAGLNLKPNGIGLVILRQGVEIYRMESDSLEVPPDAIPNILAATRRSPS